MSFTSTSVKLDSISLWTVCDRHAQVDGSTFNTKNIDGGEMKSGNLNYDGESIVQKVITCSAHLVSGLVNVTLESRNYFILTVLTVVNDCK